MSKAADTVTGFLREIDSDDDKILRDEINSMTGKHDIQQSAEFLEIVERVKFVSKKAARAREKNDITRCPKGWRKLTV